VRLRPLPHSIRSSLTCTTFSYLGQIVSYEKKNDLETFVTDTSLLDFMALSFAIKSFLEIDGLSVGYLSSVV
jgi:hypothetical protein